MTAYSEGLWLNGRFVSFRDVVECRALPRTMYEGSTLTFLREWFLDTPSFMQPTSGSTGPAKEIKIKREQMVSSALLSVQALGIRPSTNALICIDTRYIGGKMMLVRSLVNKMAMWVLDPCALPLQKLPVNQCVNFAAFVPYQVQALLGSKHPHLLNGIDTIIIGGAPLAQDHVSALLKYQCDVFAAYGMTESLSHVALRKLNGPDATDNYQALPGVGLSTDDRGCLIIDAPYLEERLITNDLVELVNGREFRWLGRWDNVINTGGHKVAPEKVEAAIQDIFNRAGINSRFFVHGIADNKWGNSVALVVESSGSSVREIHDTMKDIRRTLNEYEVPRAILIAPVFRFTETQKINRLETLKTVTDRISLVK